MTTKKETMATQKNNTVVVNLKSTFDSKTLTLKGNKTKSFWNVHGKTPIFVSPPLKVTALPYSSFKNKYSVQVRLDSNKKGSQKAIQQFKDLMTHVATYGKKYAFQEAQRIIKKNVSEKQVDVKYVKAEDAFYLEFYSTTIVSLLNLEKSRSTKKCTFDKQTSDPRKLLGVGATLVVYFTPAFSFYKFKKPASDDVPYCLNPFKFQVSKIKVYNGVPIEDLSTLERPTYSRLEGFAFDLPKGYTGPKQQSKTKIYDLNDFDSKKLVVEPVSQYKTKEGVLRNSLNAVYSGSRPIYFKTRVLVKRTPMRSEEFKSRSLNLASHSSTKKIRELLHAAWPQITKSAMEGADLIWPHRDQEEELSLEIAQELGGIPRLPITKDLSLKFPLIIEMVEQKDKKGKIKKVEVKTDKPKFSVYVLQPNEEESKESKEGEKGKVIKLEMKESCKIMEPYLTAGTLVDVIFSVSPVIVNDLIFCSMRVQQILIDPNLPKEEIPTIRGYAFPEPKNVSLERYNGVIDTMDSKELHFSELTGSKIKYIEMTGKNGTPYFLYGTTSNPVINYAFDVPVENTQSEDQKYDFSFTGSLDLNTNPSLMDQLKRIHGEVVKHCVKNSKTIFGAPKKANVVKMKVKPFIKYGKKDKEKKYPSSKIKMRPLNPEGETLLFPYQLYMRFPGGRVKQIRIRKREDIQSFAYRGATTENIVTVKFFVVNGYVYPSLELIQGCHVPDPTIPFMDDNPDSPEEEENFEDNTAPAKSKSKEKTEEKAEDEEESDDDLGEDEQSDEEDAEDAVDLEEVEEEEQSGEED